MPTEIRPSARQHDESNAVRAGPGARAQGFEYDERPSIARRAFRALFRFIVAVLIGVGLTLAWQSHGDEGVKLARSYAPSLAWLLPVPKTKTSPSNEMSAATNAIEVKQQLEPIAREFDVVQHSIQQLATSIQQLATKIDELAANQVTLNRKAVEEGIRSSPPPATNAAQAPERGTKPDEPDVAASAGAAPNAADTAGADRPASNKCNIAACKEAYFTFNPVDCTYQPLEGPRRLCTK